MALFPNLSEYTFKGRTHTHLVVSEGDAPAEKWVVSKNEGVKFTYAYGPEGNQNVVLAKGKIVELADNEYDPETGRMVTAVKQAVASSKNVVGVNLRNLYERKRDRFSGGNQPNPTIITRSYIEVPLFEHAVEATAQAYASAMKFGAAYGVTNGLKPGDYVKVGVDGNFVKLDTATDSPFEVVGQVYAVERELPPAGFLQYYMEMKIEELEAFLKQQSYAPSPGKNPDGSAGAYPYGYPYTVGGWQADFEKLLNPTINKGIPFLTDGYFRAKQTVTNVLFGDKYDQATNNDGHIEHVTFSGQVTYIDSLAAVVADYDSTVTGVQTAANSRNNALFIKLRHAIDKGESNPVVVKHDGGTFAAADVHVDYTNNTVVVYLEENQTYQNIKLDLKLVVDPVAGIPTEWDYAGSVGAVRILLQK